MSPTVAVVQAGAVLFDGYACVTKAEQLIADAAGRGARMAVFPEAFIGGYPKGEDFGARVGSRTEEGRKLFRRYFEGAIDVPGPATERLGYAASDYGMWLVIGVIERGGGTLYCTVLFFAPDGSLAGKHRKLMPTAMERLIWGFGDGSTLPVIDTGFGRIGAVICWENYMPLLRGAMYRQGNSALLRADRGRSRDLARHHAPHRAGRALLRALGVPVDTEAIRRRQHDRGTAGRRAGGPAVTTASASSPPIWTWARSPKASSTWM